ncbi:transforming growth factor beta receptor type 3-like [Babylonia areolata]|uniref:transforming growth factor beta receptor type 3-like n=1 Tax=Babylonia areolata TaxID=304850 RepID=UPI003FD0F4EF
MLLKYWTAIVFSLWVNGPTYTRQDPGGSSAKCHVQADPHPQYVVAYLRHYLPGRGCHSNATSPSHQLVHVINLRMEGVGGGGGWGGGGGGDGGGRPTVSLKIEPKDFSSSSSSSSLLDSGMDEGAEGGQNNNNNNNNSVEEGEEGEVGWPKDQKLVFVLNSVQPVKWKVEVSSKFPQAFRQRFQRFLVQSHSAIRFRKRKGRAQLRGRRRKMPSAEDEGGFLEWVRKQFGAVTSYTEVNGDQLLFYVGQVEGARPECLLNETKASPFALVAHKEKQPVTGCISSGIKNVLDRPVHVIELQSIAIPVYVIELQSVPDGSTDGEQQVELDIMSANDKKIDHDLYLVLRSPPSIKWVLRSHRVYGWIDVVTNADADLRGIRMHTVALRREQMEATGVDLIRWTDYYVAPVRAYTAVSSANILQLLLPSADTKDTDPWEPSVLTPKDVGGGGGRGSDQPSSGHSGHHHRGGHHQQRAGEDNPSTDMREHLRQIIKTRCEGGVMEVAFPAVLTQGLDLPVDQLTLLDGSCRATKNSSHVIFRTALDQCGTRKMTVDEEDVYSNAIVIHATGMAGAILEEELGSGYFDLPANSGSGWMEDDGDDSSTTYEDDEDFTSHRVDYDVECRVPRSESDNGQQKGQESGRRGQEGKERGVCTLQVFDDPLFLQRVLHFPHTSSTATGIYLQASAPHDPNIHVLMENCWVTRWHSPQHNDAQQTVLIQQGCTRSSGVSWVRYDTGGATASTRGRHQKESTTPERLMIYRDLPQGSYVHCQLSRCFKGSSLPGQKCPPDPSDHCNSNVLPNMFPQLRTQSCGIHTVGPVEITDQEVRILEGRKMYRDVCSTKDPKGTRTNTPHRKSGRGSSSSQGEGQVQQSVIIEGLDSGTVVGIAFAAFAIGILLTGALWFIHTHTGPSKRGMSAVSMVGMSGDVTPNSSSPISA